MYSFLSFPLTLRTMLSNFGAPSSVTYPMGLVVFSVLSPDVQARVFQCHACTTFLCTSNVDVKIQVLCVVYE